MIGISTRLYDPEGFVLLQVADISNNDDVSLSRRVSSVKTLDGGSYTSDFGYAQTDDDIVVTLPNVSLDISDKLSNMLKLHSKLVVSTSRGAFECISKTLVQRSGDLTMTFAVIGTA